MQYDLKWWAYLPSGKITKSQTLYVREWNKLGKKILKFFPGYCVVGYDPGLSLAIDRISLIGAVNLNKEIIKAFLLADEQIQKGRNK